MKSSILKLAQIYRSMRPWLLWLVSATACAVGYLVFYTQIMGRSGTGTAVPTLIVTFAFIMLFAFFIWLPVYWALGKWYRRLVWSEAILVSGLLAAILTTILGIGPFSASVGSPFYSWFLLVAIMVGAAGHVSLTGSKARRTRTK